MMMKNAILKSIVLPMLILFINLSYALNVEPINNFDSTKYLGTWYEVVRLPNRFEKKCFQPIIAKYEIDTNNSSQIIITNSCNLIDGSLNTATGIAKFTDKHNIGKLDVTFLPTWLRWLPFGYGDYWILYTDYNSVSLVGSKDGDYLWVLSRTKNIDEAILNKVLQIAKIQGFDTSKIIFTHSKF